MAPVSSQSVRGERTTGDLSMSSRSLPHSRSIPVNLETVDSEDSSVFAGLDKLKTPRNGPPETLCIKKKIQGVRFQEDGLRSAPTHVGRYKLKSLGNEDAESEFGEAATAILSVVRSSSNTSSEQSFMRQMKPMTDADSAFATESVDIEDSLLMESQSNLSDDHNYHHSRKTSKNYGQSSYLHDQDLGSHISYGSVNSYVKPRGTFNMVSQVTFLDDVQEEASQDSNRPGNDERITAMLDDYERQMEATLQSLTQDEDRDDAISINRDYLAEMQDIVPHRIASEDAGQTLTYEQSKKLQRVLHQARTEVEVLKDNNEQFVSEIEQQEEEYESEKKLLQERTRQKITELKQMYQEEMESLIKEKDAAIVEAQRQAVRYGESGRKQIASLKSQLEKVKSRANDIIRQKIEEAITQIQDKKEEELSARLGALRKSYESELEKMRIDRDSYVQNAVNEAVASSTHQLLADRDKQVNERMQAVHSVQDSLGHKEREIATLRQERDGFINTLESIRTNIIKHYPSEMGDLRERTQVAPGPFGLLEIQNKPEEGSLEDLFKEVIESFGYLLDKSATETKVVSSYDLVEIEDLKKKINEQNYLITRQRGCIENMQKQKEQDREKIERLESSFKRAEQEKRLLEEEHEEDLHNQKHEIEKMHSADEAFYEMEKRRKNLAEAMAVGEFELANSRSRHRSHFLKPVDACHSSLGPEDRESMKESANESFESEYESSVQDGTTTADDYIQQQVDASIAEGINHHDTSFKSNEDENEESKSHPSGEIVGVRRENHGEEKYQSPAKKKSYAILNNFKSFRQSHHQRSNMGMENPEDMESEPVRKPLTRAEKVRGLFDSVRQEDNSTRTMNSIADASISSLKTNTGADGSKSAAADIKSSSDVKRAGWKKFNGRKRNPLGMFAQARKDKQIEKDGEDDSFQIPPPPLPQKTDVSRIDVGPQRGPAEMKEEIVGTDDIFEEKNSKIQPSLSFKKKPLPGFDGRVINGKKPALHDYGKSNADELSHDGRSEQENQFPSAIAVHSTSKNNAAPANGHTMCLRPLSVESPKDQMQDNVSLLTDNNCSLHTTSDTNASTEESSYGQQQMRRYPPRTDTTSGESGYDTASCDKYSTPETPAHSGLSETYTQSLSSISEPPVVVQGHDIYKPKYQPRREAALSPTSEATTAVVSHRQRSSIAGFYNRSNQERRSVRVARVVGDKTRHATNFASKVRARRVAARRQVPSAN